MFRDDIKGFTFKVFTFFIEVVYYKSIFNVRTIAINRKKLDSKTFYVVDRWGV